MLQYQLQLPLQDLEAVQVQVPVTPFGRKEAGAACDEVTCTFVTHSTASSSAANGTCRDRATGLIVGEPERAATKRHGDGESVILGSSCASLASPISRQG